jgi:Spy/CpxP family protein refolding chaperone
MKKYALPLLLIFSLAINLAAASALFYHYWCLHRGEPGLTCGRKPLRRILRDSLHLGEGEVSRFQSCFDQDREAFIHLRGQIHRQRQILYDLLDTSEPDRNEIDQQIERISLLQAKMEKLIMKRIIAIKSDLPEEKQKKFLDTIRQRAGRGPHGPPSDSGGWRGRRWWR